MDHTKTLQQILDNPSNDLTASSRSLIESTILALRLEQPFKVASKSHENKVAQLFRPFKDEPERTATMSASINTEGWLSVIYHSNEITASVFNWKKLVALVHQVLPDEKGGY